MPDGKTELEKVSLNIVPQRCYLETGRVLKSL